MANRIITRRDTAANWAAVNPILAQGEKGLETDGLGTATVLEKIGDGVTAWNTLPYIQAGGGDVETVSGDGVNNTDPKNPVISFPTATEVGLGNVDNTADADKPVSTATQSALNDKADASDLTSHENDSSNPHSVTKTQVGLSNVDNTSDANKPVSDATQSALNDKADGSDLTSHENDSSNPHSVTKSQVGLGSVDNTSDANKPVSTATQSALNDKADDSALTSHVNNNSNPHSVDASDVGLGNVDNTSDVDKPISTATQTALDTKLESVPNATHNVAGIVKMSRDSATSKVYISFDGTDVPNVS